MHGLPGSNGPPAPRLRLAAQLERLPHCSPPTGRVEWLPSPDLTRESCWLRRYLDSHHHGDHAYGNAVFAKEGATIVAQANCAHLLRTDGPREFAEAGKGKNGRKDIRESFLKVPSMVFDDKLVFDDGKQRVEMLFFG